ncbi:MAG: hypothetical protein EXR50_03960 [Dehalococcoidia bacterium]|nr:hypothetical protein [Dehalococcoidia bacterium]
MENYLPRPSITACYGYAWKSLWNNFFPLLGISIVFSLLEGMPGKMLASDAAYVYGEGVGKVLSLLYYLLVSAPLGYGLAYVYLGAARDEEATLGALFAPFKRSYISSVISYMLVTLLVAIGTALLIVPGIIIAVRLAFVPLIVVDEKLGPAVAIQERWRRTSGSFWRMFGSWMLAIPILLVGVIIFFVGFFPALMWVYMTWVTWFIAITAHKVSPDRIIQDNSGSAI